jgi:hypothetical protein
MSRRTSALARAIAWMMVEGNRSGLIDPRKMTRSAPKSDAGVGTARGRSGQFQTVETGRPPATSERRADRSALGVMTMLA